MNALLAAEQAVLGAILLDPDQLDHLEWLEPEHFYRPAHQALFAALRKHRREGKPAAASGEPVPLSWMTEAVDEANRHVRGLDSNYGHTLVVHCPRPGHAPAYGRMVLEAHIRRTVTEHAVRLQQAARAGAATGAVEDTLHYADVLAEVLDALARQWGTDPRPLAPASPPGRTDDGRPPSQEESQDEPFLLAVLTERPGAMDEVVGWLRPDDFADPAHGLLYRCLGALHHRGEPIDRVTLLWEA